MGAGVGAGVGDCAVADPLGAAEPLGTGAGAGFALGVVGPEVAEPVLVAGSLP